jgi:hypothetical protein
VTNQPSQSSQLDADQAPSTDQGTAAALAGAGAYIQTLPSVERHVATLAARGSTIPEIAAATGQSEAAIARTIDGVLAAVTCRHRDPVETGGLGADTDPGVTGGYGDTGFGSLDTDPITINEEPDEG